MSSLIRQDEPGDQQIVSKDHWFLIRVQHNVRAQLFTDRAQLVWHWNWRCWPTMPSWADKSCFLIVQFLVSGLFGLVEVQHTVRAQLFNERAQLLQVWSWRCWPTMPSWAGQFCSLLIVQCLLTELTTSAAHMVGSLEWSILRTSVIRRQDLWKLIFLFCPVHCNERKMLEIKLVLEIQIGWVFKDRQRWQCKYLSNALQ